MNKKTVTKKDISKASNVDISDLQLLRIRTLDQRLNISDEYLNMPDPPKLNPMVHVAHKSFINPKSELLTHTLLFSFKTQLEEQSTNPLATFDIVLEFLFKVNDLEKYIVAAGPPLKVLFELEATLLSIALSTSRGIILERTMSNPFRGILIPVIDIAKYLQPSNSTAAKS